MSEDTSTIQKTKELLAKINDLLGELEKELDGLEAEVKVLRQKKAAAAQ